MSIEVRATARRDTFNLNLNLNLRPGETVGLTGDIGTGKSTALLLLAGRLEPTAGEIGGIDGSVTMLSQMFQTDLAEERTGVENVMAASHQEGELEARRLLSELGLEDHVVDRLPWTFSGAESQRVALARALAPRPKLVLLDEPTGALDKRLRARVTDFLETWLAGFEGVAVVASTNQDLLDRLCDRVVDLSH